VLRLEFSFCVLHSARCRSSSAVFVVRCVACCCLRIHCALLFLLRVRDSASIAGSAFCLLCTSPSACVPSWITCRLLRWMRLLPAPALIACGYVDFTIVTVACWMLLFWVIFVDFRCSSACLLPLYRCSPRYVVCPYWFVHVLVLVVGIVPFVAFVWRGFCHVYRSLHSSAAFCLLLCVAVVDCVIRCCFVCVTGCALFRRFVSRLPDSCSSYRCVGLLRSDFFYVLFLDSDCSLLLMIAFHSVPFVCWVLMELFVDSLIC